jgi:exoV-like protein
MGDLLNPLIIERCFGYRVERCSFLTGDLCAIGSGLAQYKLHGNPLMKLKQCINGRTHPHVDVWGSGFINYDDAQGRFFKRDMCFHAVRGELTRRSVERMTGRTLDIPTGDGGILADELLDTLPEKRYDIGIVPHVCDLNDPAVTDLLGRYENAKFINVKDDPITVLTEIAQCRCILSSSLHGLIAADSFHIPNLHIVFSDRPLGDGYKFDDYYSAYGVQHSPRDLRVSAAPAIAEIRDGWRIRPEQVEEKKRQMRAAFPYPAVNGGSL